MGTLYAGFDLRGNHNYLGIIDGDGAGSEGSDCCCPEDVGEGCEHALRPSMEEGHGSKRKEGCQAEEG